MDNSQTVLDYLPLIHKAVRRHMANRRLPPGVDHEDLVQDLYEPMLKAVGTFDPKKGVVLATWLHLVARFTLLGFARDRSWGPRVVEDRKVQKTGMDLEVFPEGPVHDDVEFQDLLDWVMPPGSRNAGIVRAYLQGWTLTEIAKREGISRQRAHQIIKREMPLVRERAEKIRNERSRRYKESL